MKLLYNRKPKKSITDATENKLYITTAEINGFLFSTTLTIFGSAYEIRLTSSNESKLLGFIARIKLLPMIFFKGMMQKALTVPATRFG